NDTATTEIYPLSLHDALPIYSPSDPARIHFARRTCRQPAGEIAARLVYTPGAVYWLTPPAGPRPKRVEILGDFLIEKVARHTKREGRAAPAGMPRPAGTTKWS